MIDLVRDESYSSLYSSTVDRGYKMLVAAVTAIIAVLVALAGENTWAGGMLYACIYCVYHATIITEFCGLPGGLGRKRVSGCTTFFGLLFCVMR